MKSRLHFLLKLFSFTVTLSVSILSLLGTTMAVPNLPLIDCEKDGSKKFAELVGLPESEVLALLKDVWPRMIFGGVDDLAPEIAEQTGHSVDQIKQIVGLAWNNQLKQARRHQLDRLKKDAITFADAIEQSAAG